MCNSVSVVQLLLLLCSIHRVLGQKPTAQPARPSVRWRSDGRCGPDFAFRDNTNDTDGLPAECDPASERPCCSDFGYCGVSTSHCTCNGCTDYRGSKVDKCYFRLEGDEGSFESPNYPSPYPVDQDCKYDIIRTSTAFCGVKIFVDDIDIPMSNGTSVCTGDWVSVESCVPEGGARLCGNDSGISYHYNFQQAATALRVAFHSDASGSGRGFRFRYKLVSDCSSYFTEVIPSNIPGAGTASCFTKISEPSGTINTPYHSKNYPENLDCVYQFVRSNPNFCGIRMKTVKFDLQPPLETPFGGACSDFFHMPTCGFLCGKMEFSWVARYQPGATSLTFHFHSDETAGFPGFLISFEQIYEC